MNLNAIKTIRYVTPTQKLAFQLHYLYKIGNI